MQAEIDRLRAQIAEMSERHRRELDALEAQAQARAGAAQADLQGAAAAPEPPLQLATQLATQLAGLGLWQWNISSGALQWDARMREIYGLGARAALSYDAWQAQLLPEHRNEFDAAMRGLGLGQARRELAYGITRPDGEQRYVRSAATLIRGVLGELRLVGVCWDDTEALRAAQEARSDSAALQRTNAELVRAARVRDEFLAAMSHELRTPLNAVLGLAEMLLEGIHGALTPEQAHSVQTIEESGRHLLELISDILEASTIEAGTVELHPSWVDLGLLLDAVRRRYAPAAGRKGLRLSFALAPGLQRLWADERRVLQMLGNLLSNAIKFTPEGGEVAVRLGPSTDGSDLWMQVQDTGIGIADADLQRLFLPFVQLDAGLDRRYGGTGLGLSLVRTLAELHGGEVDVQSTPGRGSTFRVALPLKPLNRPDSGLQAARAASGVFVGRSAAVPGPLVLVAEDNDTNFELLDAYLSAQGYRVVRAADGLEALTKGRSLRPDLVLMDIQMPGMDGLEATQLLRADSDPKVARVPIIAVTAMALPGDRERCLQAGVDGYLAKPISLHALSATMEGLLAPLETAEG